MTNMESVLSKHDKPTSDNYNSDNSEQLPYEEPNHPGATSVACCVPNIGYCMSESNQAEPGIGQQMEVSNNFTQATSPNVQNPPLPPANDCNNLGNVAENDSEEDSETECARLPLLSKKYVSSRKRRGLPLFKEAKVACMDRHCLPIANVNDNQKMLYEDINPASSPAASLGKHCLLSASPRRQFTNKHVRRCLFGKAGSSSDTYFYNLASPTNNSGKSSHEDIASILNSLFNPCSGQVSPESLSSRDNNSSRQASLDLHSPRHPSTDSDNSSVESTETESPSRPGPDIDLGKELLTSKIAGCHISSNGNPVFFSHFSTC